MRRAGYIALWLLLLPITLLSQDRYGTTPFLLTGSGSPSGGAVVYWTNLDSVGAAVSSYSVYRSTTTQGGWVYLASVVGHYFYLDVEGASDTKYWYYVSATIPSVHLVLATNLISVTTGPMGILWTYWGQTNVRPFRPPPFGEARSYSQLH